MNAAAPATTDAVIARIRAWMEATRQSAEAFAGIAGVAGNTVRGIERDDWQPSVKTLRKLEAVIPPGWQPDDPVPDPLQAPLAEENNGSGEGPEEAQGPEDEKRLGGEVQAAALNSSEAA
jgi:transcriptional regulator with XRE-family HTH domain